MDKVLVYLLSGKAGVGKSFSGDFIRLAYSTKGYKTINLPYAEGVKAVATSMGWNGKKDSAGRALLQSIGNAGRQYDNNTWVNMAINKYFNHPQYPIDVVTMDDWRYSNEYEQVNNNPLFKVIAIRIESPHRELLKDNETLYNDISEISLDKFDRFSYVIDNPIENPDAVLTALSNIIVTETLKNRR